MTNEVEIRISDRLTVKLGLSALYQTATMEVNRVTAFGSRRRLFLTPLQYHAIILNEQKVNAIVKSISVDAKDPATRPDENSLYSLPLDPRKSIAVEIFKGKIYVTVNTIKQEEIQRGLAFGFEFSTEWQSFMKLKEKILETLEEIKRGITMTALRNSRDLSTFRWVLVNSETGKKILGRRYYFTEAAAFGWGRQWAEQEEGDSTVSCVHEHRMAWPEVNVIFKCALLATVTQAYDEALKETEPSVLTAYERARSSVTPKSLDGLLREVYLWMGDKRRYEGADTVPPLTSEEEIDLQKMVEGKLHNNLTDMEMSLFLTCYDAIALEVYPDHICGWFTEKKDKRTTM